MCGRCCLTLDPCQIQQACKYKNAKENEYESIPEWRSEYNFGRKYEPSYNITPSDITPVLVSSDYFENSNENDKILQKDCGHCIVSMLWGMIPFWHKGDYRKHGLTTNNCRLEHMLESKLYSAPFRKGQRCVILCEGFYEWQTTLSTKPSKRTAYYVYMHQKEGIKMYDKTTWGQECVNLNLLKLAGLFDSWKDENGDIIYSYSIITFESDKMLSWLHHRTPAILETQQQVADWLDFKRVPHTQALKILKAPTQLSWYRVSNLVNNSRNKHADCNKPLTVVEKQGAKNNFLKNWLTVRKRKEEELKKVMSSDSDEFYDSDIDNEDEVVRVKRKKH